MHKSVFGVDLRTFIHLAVTWFAMSIVFSLNPRARAQDHTFFDTAAFPTIFFLAFFVSAAIIIYKKRYIRSPFFLHAFQAVAIGSMVFARIRLHSGYDENDFENVMTARALSTFMLLIVIGVVGVSAFAAAEPIHNEETSQ